MVSALKPQGELGNMRAGRTYRCLIEFEYDCQKSQSDCAYRRVPLSPFALNALRP